jgi:alkylation response protein AidB-like acyl-CoA dehydrogenase
MVNHGTNQLFIDNLVLSREALIGEEGKGFSYVLSSLNAERILVGSESIGDGRWFVEYPSNMQTSGAYSIVRSA